MQVEPKRAMSADSTDVSPTANSDQNDKTLIDGCRAGDSEAWDLLINKYQRLVMSVPLSFGFDTPEAEDIAQITFTILMQSLDNLRNVDHLGSWLYTVAQRHTWRVLKRSQNNAPEAIDDDIAESRVVFGREGLNDLDRWEMTDWLNQSLNRLGWRCQELLVALYFDPDEPNYVQVAQRLKMAVGSIGPTRARCLKSLQRLLLGAS